MTEHANLADSVAAMAQRHHFRVGVAESLTSGQLAAELGASPAASEWFRGGVVAYAADVKFDLLGVTPGPVVSAECAREMALGATRLLRADAVVATTGVGGQEPAEGEPPGTVFVAAVVRGHVTGVRLDLDGRPEDVLRQTRTHAFEVLVDAMGAATAAISAAPRPGTAHGEGPGSPSPATPR